MSEFAKRTSAKIRLAGGSRDRPAPWPCGQRRLGLPDADAGPVDQIGDPFCDRAPDVMAADRNGQSVISKLQSAHIADYGAAVCGSSSQIAAAAM